MNQRIAIALLAMGSLFFTQGEGRGQPVRDVSRIVFLSVGFGQAFRPFGVEKEAFMGKDESYPMLLPANALLQFSLGKTFCLGGSYAHTLNPGLVELGYPSSDYECYLGIGHLKRYIGPYIDTFDRSSTHMIGITTYEWRQRQDTGEQNYCWYVMLGARKGFDGKAVLPEGGFFVAHSDPDGVVLFKLSVFPLLNSTGRTSVGGSLTIGAGFESGLLGTVGFSVGGPDRTSPYPGYSFQLGYVLK